MLLQRRRGQLAATLVSTSLVLAAAAGMGAPADAAAKGATGASYTWRNARIDGGGFIPGVIFNQARKGLVYVRTDIGGAYRQDPKTGTWIPLTDSIGWKEWGLTGVASLASDPVQPNRVYLAAGTYTNASDPGMGAILRSTDYGTTWKKTTLPFKLGGNMPGRGMGERLTIDPDDDRILYLGAPSGNGLWRSTDRGVKWRKVTAFPDVGDYAPDPSDPSGYSSDKEGVLWEVFDKSTGRPGHATGTVYVGVADKAGSIYRSTDAGATWQRVSGQPTGLIPHKAVLDDTGGSLYIAYSDTGGPYDGSTGALYKLDTATGDWTDISPQRNPSGFGYSGLTIDRQHPGTLMVTGYSSWWPDTSIWRSTDGGTTWKSLWDWGNYPDRTLHYSLDASADPWLTFGNNPTPPEVTPKLGWMTETLEIDPFDSDRMMYGTGATLYGTDNLTAWDNGGTVGIKPVARGIEETAVLDLISPPTGAHLLSGLGDIGGMRHTDLDTPQMMYTGPVFGSTTSLDYAGLNGDDIVRAGNGSHGHFARSTDNGATWNPGPAEPSGVTGGGTVALGADGSRTVWAPDGASAVYHATGDGDWAAATGVPAGAAVEADRVDPLKFYAFSAGTFYVSTDGGATFTATAATGLPAEGNARFQALPGTSGDVWLAGGKDDGTYGLWHSTDSGATFTRVKAVQQADTIGFGKAAPGSSYPALYSSAQIHGTRGIFRSDDAGKTWVRINDDQHQWGWTGAAITGDMRIYGRVYVATNGRGVIYGDVK